MLCICFIDHLAQVSLTAHTAVILREQGHPEYFLLRFLLLDDAFDVFAGAFQLINLLAQALQSLFDSAMADLAISVRVPALTGSGTIS